MQRTRGAEVRNSGRNWRLVALAGSGGRGEGKLEGSVREFTRVGDGGPRSVEWEDSGMDGEHGAIESCEFVRNVDFSPSSVAFDAAFDQ